MRSCSTAKATENRTCSAGHGRNGKRKPRAILSSHTQLVDYRVRIIKSETHIPQSARSEAESALRKTSIGGHGKRDGILPPTPFTAWPTLPDPRGISYKRCIVHVTRRSALPTSSVAISRPSAGNCVATALLRNDGTRRRPHNDIHRHAGAMRTMIVIDGMTTDDCETMWNERCGMARAPIRSQAGGNS